MRYILEVRCESDSAPVRVRAWVDPLSLRALDDELELLMSVDPEGVWCGIFDVPAKVARFFYRIAIVGPAPGKWTMRLWARHSTLVLEDSDELDPPKTWIAGTCDRTPVGVASQVTPSRHDAVPAPSLLLLRAETAQTDVQLPPNWRGPRARRSALDSRRRPR